MESNFGVSVTIGRNVGSVPMSQDDWEMFMYRVLAELNAACRTWEAYDDSIFEQGEGEGIWDGVREENYRVACHGLIEDVARGIAADIRTPLKDIALAYGQDAVAVGIVQTELVGY